MLVALMLVGVAGIAAAAHERAARVREIALALVDALPRSGVRAEILRFSEPNRRDVILLPRDATADTLAAALVSYRRASAGATARQAAVERLTVTDAQLSVRPDARVRARAARLLAKVRSARPSQIGSYGRGRWTTITVRVTR